MSTPVPATDGVVALSPLHEVHRGLGAAFTDFAGWRMPVRYSGHLAEHEAVRTAAGLFDLSHMGELRVTGAGAAAALDAALVGEPSALATGRAGYTLLCAEDGGVLDDLVVYRLGEADFLVVPNAANVATVLAALRERTAGRADVAVADETARTALLAVQGPRAQAVVEAATGRDLAGLRYYSVTDAVCAGTPVLLARTGYTGEDGFELYVPTGAAEAVWAALSTAGAAHGLLPCGLAARDTLRLEAAMPLHGHELGPATSPFAAGLGRVVRFTKPGGFVGRDALLRQSADPATEVLVGLRGTGRRAAREGCPVLDGTGAVVGVVTSGALSPTLGHPVALARVAAGSSAPGGSLTVDVRGKALDVTVVPTPFYRRPR